jgi:hypothetical protein
MNTETVKQIIAYLNTKDIIFEKGLSNEESNAITVMFGIVFPPDLLCFLQTALPISTGFVNWRAALNDKGERKRIKERLSWPLEGILFDVHNNVFWDNEWGRKPDDTESQIKTVTQHYKRYPTLVPIYSHRYIPAFPIEEGNPVFSVYQTDIVYYGYDIISYFCNEFQYKSLEYTIPAAPKQIEFWGKMAT